MRRVAKRILPKGTDVLLVIDQFEELFTLTADEQARRGFLDGLDSDPAMHPYLVPLAIHACRERSDKPGSPTHWSNRIIDSLIESPARERDRQGDPRRRSSRL